MVRIQNLLGFFQSRMNMLTYADFSDPADQLAWLIDEFQDSEEVGKKVEKREIRIKNIKK